MRDVVSSFYSLYEGLASEPCEVAADFLDALNHTVFVTRVDV